jgi:hypothetical protein
MAEEELGLTWQLSGGRVASYDEEECLARGVHTQGRPNEFWGLRRNFKTGPYFFIYFLIILLYFYLKIIILAFWDAKLLIKFLYSRFSNIIFSIDKMANPFNLSCNIVDLR